MRRWWGIWENEAEERAAVPVAPQFRPELATGSDPAAGIPCRGSGWTRRASPGPGGRAGLDGVAVEATRY